MLVSLCIHLLWLGGRRERSLDGYGERWWSLNRGLGLEHKVLAACLPLWWLCHLRQGLGGNTHSPLSAAAECVPSLPCTFTVKCLFEAFDKIRSHDEITGQAGKVVVARPPGRFAHARRKLH